MAGAIFASRVSYVISPEGKILSAVSDSGATKHIESALAAVKAWKRQSQP
jgi:peroxiredoxin